MDRYSQPDCGNPEPRWHTLSSSAEVSGVRVEGRGAMAFADGETALFSYASQAVKEVKGTK